MTRPLDKADHIESQHNSGERLLYCATRFARLGREFSASTALDWAHNATDMGGSLGDALYAHHAKQMEDRLHAIEGADNG